MIRTIAIQPDYIERPNGTKQSFSNVWQTLADKFGISIKPVDVYSNNFLDQLHDVDAFMWRINYAHKDLELAKQLFPIINNIIGIPTFPNPSVPFWLDDKIYQTYLFRAAGISSPKTCIFWDKDSAITFLKTANYPLVIKLSQGNMSSNVGLIKSFHEANDMVEQMFSRGINALWKAYTPKHRRLVRDILETIRHPKKSSYPGKVEKDYILLQEFISGNNHDTRITVIGKYAFGFVRYNRENDFRASGSGKLEYDPSLIPIEYIEMAFDIANRLDEPFLGLDFLHTDSGAKVIEVTFAYASYAIENCPGSWIMEKPLDPSSIRYQSGHISPEALTLQEFIRLNSSH